MKLGGDARSVVCEVRERRRDERCEEGRVRGVEREA